jgi:hypothetical protein
LAWVPETRDKNTLLRLLKSQASRVAQKVAHKEKRP